VIATSTSNTTSSPTSNTSSPSAASGEKRASSSVHQQSQSVKKPPSRRQVESLRKILHGDTKDETERMFTDANGKRISFRTGLADNLSTIEAIGFYFGASWCAPCKGFSAVLKGVYEKINEKQKRFEVVFLSSDRTLQSFHGYLKSMPWLALPFQSGTIAKLSNRFAVDLVPTLIILLPDGRVLTREGASAVAKLGAQGFPWGDYQESCCVML